MHFVHRPAICFISTDLLSRRTNVVYSIIWVMRRRSEVGLELPIPDHALPQALEPEESIMNTRTERREVQRSLPLHSHDNGCQWQPSWKETLVTHSYNLHTLINLCHNSDFTGSVWKPISLNVSGTVTCAQSCYGQLS